MTLEYAALSHIIMRAAGGHSFAFYVTLVCLRDPNVGGAGSKNEYPHRTQAGHVRGRGIELTGAKINLSPEEYLCR